MYVTTTTTRRIKLSFCNVAVPLRVKTSVMHYTLILYIVARLSVSDASSAEFTLIVASNGLAVGDASCAEDTSVERQEIQGIFMHTM